jgi:hypothetical protein
VDRGDSGGKGLGHKRRVLKRVLDVPRWRGGHQARAMRGMGPSLMASFRNF